MYDATLNRAADDAPGVVRKEDILSLINHAAECFVEIGKDAGDMPTQIAAEQLNSANATIAAAVQQILEKKSAALEAALKTSNLIGPPVPTPAPALAPAPTPATAPVRIPTAAPSPTARSHPGA